MNWKQLIRLLIVAAVVIGIGIVLNWMRYRAEEAARGEIGTDVFADFPLNEIQAVEIAAPDSSVTIVKEDGVWRVKDRFGYPADFEKLREFLISLNDLTVTQAVPAAPSQYGRLGLADAGAENAGMKVTFSNQAGTEVAAIVLGNTYQQSGQQGMGWPAGRYIRVPQESKDLVALVATSFSRIQADPAEWLDDQFVEIKDVVEAHLKDQDGIRWTIERETTNAAWRLQGFEPRENQSFKASTAESVANAFSYGSFQDVAGTELGPDQTGLDAPTVFAARTEDGIVYALNIGAKNDDGQYFLTVNATYEAPVEQAETVDGDDRTEGDQTTNDDADAEKTADEMRELVEDINRRFGGWIYLVRAYNVDRVLKERNAFIETTASEEDEAPAADTGTDAPQAPPPQPPQADATNNGDE